MSDAFFRIALAEDHYMCISPLDEEVLESAMVDGLGDEFGYFVYETRGRRDCLSIEVLAKCPTYEAAMRLLDFLVMSPLRLASA